MDGLQARAGSARSIQWMAVTAVLMGMNVALSSFGVPVPGGHLYLNDIVICTAGILLDPLGASKHPWKELQRQSLELR